MEPLDYLIYTIKYIEFKKEILVFNEAYGNILFILDKNVNDDVLNNILNNIEITIILSKNKKDVKIKYKLNSSIFSTIRNKCKNIHIYNEIKNTGYLIDGRKYLLYKKVNGKIAVICKYLFENNEEIDRKQYLINNYLKYINISIFIKSEKEILIEKLNDLSEYNIDI